MKVRAYVHVRSADGRESAVLKPGDTVPEWAEVTNPAALEDSPAEAVKAPVEEVPAEAEVALVAEQAPAKKAPARKAPARKAAPKATEPTE